MTIRFLLAVMAICGLAVFAEPRTATAAISTEAATHWQGWYAGVDAGLADTSNSWSANGEPLVQSPLTTDNGTAGLVGGYNRVRNDGLFYGGEADINYMTNSSTEDHEKSIWKGYATARGRIGMAFDPALVFLTGGLALTEVDNELTEPTGDTAFNFTDKYIHVGWTAGAGAEFALTDNTSMSAQYLRLQMPQDAHPPCGNCFGGTYQYKMMLNNSADILRVGFNWHFE